ncbi:unnamed protein product, partial [Sphacelaria rigidula]
EIDHLRDEVARQFFTERRAAGEGAGAYSPPTRPPSSPPLTPVTGGGRGGSPEHLRAASPRSASPRESPKGAGKTGEVDGEGRRAVGAGSGAASPTRSARSAGSGYTHYSGFSARSHGKKAASSEAAFLAQSTLTPEDLDEILKDELLKSRKWSARRKDAQDKFRRVWEARGDEYARSQRGFEEAKAARNERMRERREMEAEQVKQQKK